MQVTDAMVAKALKAYDAAVPEDHGASANGMEAALTAALAEMWRPIEDGMKDGRPGILFSPYDENMNCDGGLIWISGGYGRGAIHPGWRGETNKEPPTHFMPLPAPPRGK